MATETTIEDYLKAVWNAGEWSDAPVTVSALSARLGLSPSSVSEIVRKLTARGLLTHERYGSVDLTDAGRTIALATVRKHRLIETFLVDYLGYEWDEVHDEAEVLEHAVSDEFVERLATRLGEPTHDPHGDPIPAADGSLPAEEQTDLASVAEGERVRVARVSDDDPELLRHLRDVGIDIGAVVEVVARRSVAGTVDLSIAGTLLTLGLPAARVILTEPAA
ncbi:metal-dependent transcriptional regulator [Demequina muriae]|uniref:Manganese transport regulator n=1 Tax=Demequina muriae TaxID=3051664 RepID=A0ABT8GG23_9MICO|nr:metal-dependent transcriptional regulator [Demequina sp. EGI L300058]MDN4480389.1 metal-dependent transcriptional regulator [Demequina sp. EGI L300058]